MDVILQNAAEVLQSTCSHDCYCDGLNAIHGVLLQLPVPRICHGEPFFIACLYNAYGIIRKNDNIENWIWFGISSILGFYTIPSFLYPFITLNLVILLYNRPNRCWQFITNAIVTIITIALYLPVIIVNGLDALTNNPWVKPIDRNVVISGMPSFLKVTLMSLHSFHGGLLC